MEQSSTVEVFSTGFCSVASQHQISRVYDDKVMHGVLDEDSWFIVVNDLNFKGKFIDLLEID